MDVPNVVNHEKSMSTVLGNCWIERGDRHDVGQLGLKIIKKKVKKVLILFRISVKISIVRSESFSYQ